jgi:hypothetical protein
MVVSILLFFLFNSQINEFVKYSMFLHPWNILRLLLFLLVIVDFPDLILTASEFHNAIQLLFLRLAVLFRLIHLASFLFFTFEQMTSSRNLALLLLGGFIYVVVDYRASIFHRENPCSGKLSAVVIARDLIFLFYALGLILTQSILVKSGKPRILLSVMIFGHKIAMLLLRYVLPQHFVHMLGSLGELISDNASVYLLISTVIPVSWDPIQEDGGREFAGNIAPDVYEVIDGEGFDTE